MTKQKRAITLSTELDAAIGSLAIRHKMNYSELVERRLYENKELFDEILRLRKLPDDPVVTFEKPPVTRQEKSVRPTGRQMRAMMMHRAKKRKPQKTRLADHKRLSIPTSKPRIA